MKTGTWIITALLLTHACEANELNQKYEKAYYLETAKGQVKKAAALYQSIAEQEPSAENKAAIKNSLLRLLHIGTIRGHEATIKDCHEKLLSQTDLTIQELINLAKDGSIIHIPPGTYESVIRISKSITLTGADRNTTILTAEADQPLIHVPKKLEVTLESLTLKSQVATSERSDPPGCAILAKDSKLIVRDCAVIALANTSRCPLGVFIQGFAEVQLLDSHFEGYAYPIFYDDGSEGLVKNCVVRNPGDCGFMSHAESEVTIEGNIFTGSAKHGVRSTGGTIYARNNLIIKNHNRGFYLGNKTTHGEITNNAIVENGSGISAFASCDIEIENNVIVGNSFSGIDTRYYGRIQVKNNIITDNEKMGFAVFEKGSPKFKVGKNTFHGNGEPATDYKLPSSTIVEGPNFSDAANGDFSPGNNTVKSAGHGLTDSELISSLWKKYMETCN